VGPKARRWGLAFAVAAGNLYGSITVLSKWVDAAPLAKAALTNLAALVVVVPFLWRLRIARRDWWKVLAMGVFGATLPPVFILYGLEHANASDAGLLLTLELVATAGLAYVFLHERARLRAAIGLGCLLLAAAAVAVASSQGEDGGTDWLGILLVGLAAISWAIDNAVSTSLVGPYKPTQLLGAKFLIGSTLVGMLWGGMALIGDQPLPGPWLDWAALAFVGAAGVGAGSILFYMALDRIGAGRTSALNVPTSALAAATGGALLLGEKLGWLHAVAIAFILAGMALLWERDPHPQGGKRRRGRKTSGAS